MPGDRAEEGVAVEVLLEVVEPEHQVGRLARFVGGEDLGDDRAVGHDLHGHPVRLERIKIDGLSVFRLAEFRLRDAHRHARFILLCADRAAVHGLGGGGMLMPRVIVPRL